MGRIIAGRLASRRIVYPSGGTTRPTTDRVRESVFSLIAAHFLTADRPGSEQLAGLRFLDLFAGSGAVGLEAFSRGATVTWVEKDPLTVRIIRGNLTELSAEGEVVRGDVNRFLSRSGDPYDIVWLDPPYETSPAEIGGLLDQLVANRWLRAGGVVLVERSRRTPGVEFPDGLVSADPRRYGDTTIYFATKGS